MHDNSPEISGQRRLDLLREADHAMDQGDRRRAFEIATQLGLPTENLEGAIAAARADSLPSRRRIELTEPEPKAGDLSKSNIGTRRTVSLRYQVDYLQELGERNTPLHDALLGYLDSNVADDELMVDSGPQIGPWGCFRSALRITTVNDQLIALELSIAKKRTPSKVASEWGSPDIVYYPNCGVELHVVSVRDNQTLGRYGMAPRISLATDAKLLVEIARLPQPVKEQGDLAAMGLDELSGNGLKRLLNAFIGAQFAFAFDQSKSTVVHVFPSLLSKVRSFARAGSDPALTACLLPTERQDPERARHRLSLEFLQNVPLALGLAGDCWPRLVTGLRLGGILSALERLNAFPKLLEFAARGEEFGGLCRVERPVIGRAGGFQGKG